VIGAAVETHATSIFHRLHIGHEQSEHRGVMAVLTMQRAS
jgi:hypothetical protein